MRRKRKNVFPYSSIYLTERHLKSYLFFFFIRNILFHSSVHFFFFISLHISPVRWNFYMSIQLSILRTYFRRVNKPYTRLSINRQLLFHLRNFHEREKKKENEENKKMLYINYENLRYRVRDCAFVHEIRN